MPLTRNSFRGGKKATKSDEENFCSGMVDAGGGSAGAGEKGSKRRPRAPSGSNAENDKKNVKRTALGELTNNIVRSAVGLSKAGKGRHDLRPRGKQQKQQPTNNNHLSAVDANAKNVKVPPAKTLDPLGALLEIKDAENRNPDVKAPSKRQSNVLSILGARASSFRAKNKSTVDKERQQRKPQKSVSQLDYLVSTLSRPSAFDAASRLSPTDSISLRADVDLDDSVSIVELSQRDHDVFRQDLKRFVDESPLPLPPLVVPAVAEPLDERPAAQGDDAAASATAADFLRASPSKSKSLIKLNHSRRSEEVELDESVIDVVEIVDDELNEVDIEVADDPFQSPVYAFDIFRYYKSQEPKFAIAPYMWRQPDLTSQMRAVLVDWLVEVQENFELNHETLYLAVKLTDLYLSRHETSKEQLQLVGAASLFIASKFDERCPPCCDDFLYICDDAYGKREFVEMERDVLRTVDFQLGLPLSYRFLRRYGKVAKVSMETLTLARFVLEMSLMDYNLLEQPASLIAAATLLLAMKIKRSGEWTAALEHHSGYTYSEVTSLLQRINTYLDPKVFCKSLTTIRSKYSHGVFFEVALVGPMDDERLERILGEEVGK